jgi:hypothetical protein
MCGERGVDPLETVEMTDDVLRHPQRPAVDARQHGPGRDAEERDLGARARDQLVVGVARDVTSAEPAEVDPHEHALLGARCSHFCDDQVHASTSPPSARGMT